MFWLRVLLLLCPALWRCCCVLSGITVVAAPSYPRRQLYSTGSLFKTTHFGSIFVAIFVCPNQ